MLQFTVDNERCIHCGECASDCPVRIIEQDGDLPPHISPDLEPRCLQCQHCLAICPTGAISIFGKDPKDSVVVTPESIPTFEQMSKFVRVRRSVRRYQDKNVDAQLLSQILSALANAPTAVNQRKLTFRVIDDKEVMHSFRENVMSRLLDAVAANMIPDHLAYFRSYVEAYTTGQDLIFRSAPHVIVISAPPDAVSGMTDVVLALAYFELLAQSAGLGTVWCGMIKTAFETLPELKSLIGLPEDHHYYPMLFGLPAVRFARGVQRDDASVIERITM